LAGLHRDKVESPDWIRVATALYAVAASGWVATWLCWYVMPKLIGGVQLPAIGRLGYSAFGIYAFGTFGFLVLAALLAFHAAKRMPWVKFVALAFAFMWGGAMVPWLALNLYSDGLTVGLVPLCLQVLAGLITAAAAASDWFLSRRHVVREGHPPTSL
jgi:hypothetical protein